MRVIVVLASWEKHFIRVCQNLSQYPCILYPFVGQDMEIFKACLPPCLTMHVNLRKTLHVRNVLDYAYITYMAHDDVTYFTNVLSYDAFRKQLIVPNKK